MAKMNLTGKEGGLTEYPGLIKQKLIKLVLTLVLSSKEGIQRPSKNNGLAKEGFSQVWSDVCRTAAVFFSSCLVVK